MVAARRSQLTVKTEVTLVGEMFLEARPVFVRLKRRRDACFDGIQSQQMRGETVERADLRLLDVAKGRLGPGHDLVGRPTVARAKLGDGDRPAARLTLTAFRTHQRA